MKKSHKALLALTIIALCVGIANGVLDIYVKAAQTFTASAVTDYGEKVSIRIEGDTGRPPFLWMLAWKVGGQEVTTVTNGVTITVTGSNIASTATVDYYVKAANASGSPWTKTLQGSGVQVTVGGSLQNSTGAVAIDDHLTAIGLSTTQDQTVDYYVWVRVTATGLISSQQLVAEVQETLFDTVSFDYMNLVSKTFYSSSTDNWMGYVRKGGQKFNPVTDSGDDIYFGVTSSYYNYSGWAAFSGVGADVPAGVTIVSASLEFRTGASGCDAGGQVVIQGLDDDYFAGTVIDTYDEYWTRPRTSASVLWSFTSAWDDNTWYESPDISSIVQEIVDRSDWGGTGDDMCFFIQATPVITPVHKVCGYQTGANFKPKLHITYEGYTANWWRLPPLSIVGIPAGQQLLACVAAVIAGAIAINAIKRRKRRRRRR